MAEMDALWYHLEDMCAKVTPPDCYLCSGETKLVEPEGLYYVCPVCFPASHGWSFIEDIPYS